MLLLLGLLGATLPLPERAPDALPASALCADLPLDHDERQARLVDEILKGNVPAVGRELVAVRFRAEDASGVAHDVSLWVLPDYLAVGSDADAVRIPLDRPSAHRVARALDAWLPTPALVDRLYRGAAVKLEPEPLPPTERMTGPGYLLWHRRQVDEPLRDTLVAGHKKDVVLTEELVGRPHRLAIYGWHQAEGLVIQPLSLFHGARYADYSHGIRLIARLVEVDGVTRDAFEVLADPVLWALLSDEGPFPEAAAVLAE